jgi:DNA-binding MarR family transcriptional regulator/GNAT superfamily N-acetyltransferase
MPPALDADVAALRDFNRFYTRRIGLLNEAHLDSGFALGEVRVLFELDGAAGLTAKTLGERLDLDAGYLSRILKRFEFAGLLTRRADPNDGRSSLVSLTPQGHAAFAPLNARSQAQMSGLLAPLGAGGRQRLRQAAETIRDLLEAPAPLDAEGVRLRPHRVGDMGWVTQRHAVLYAAEHGWDERFEALVAGICADFIRTLDPAREHCWIADRDGEPLGSIFLVAGDGDVARLRLLLLEPAARGLGLGRRLVETCVAFARQAGYGEITLWTQSILTAARAVYRGAGFELTASEPHRLFGVDLVGETWTLKL